MVAKTDYALNRGVLNYSRLPQNRRFLVSLKTWQHCVGNNLLDRVRAKNVTDGLSKTYLVGERTMSSLYYETISVGAMVIVSRRTAFSIG